jgi:hypothetical protein
MEDKRVRVNRIVFDTLDKKHKCSIDLFKDDMLKVWGKLGEENEFKLEPFKLNIGSDGYIHSVEEWKVTDNCNMTIISEESKIYKIIIKMDNNYIMNSIELHDDKSEEMIQLKDIKDILNMVYANEKYLCTHNLNDMLKCNDDSRVKIKLVVLPGEKNLDIEIR